jgi:hypothetical protein
MNMIKIGGIPMQVSDAEYKVACLKEGAPVAWSGNPFHPKSGRGVVLYSWNYDGIMAVVSVNGRQETLHAYADGFSIREIGPHELNEPGMHGEGI